jgi:hypothetical protein
MWINFQAILIIVLTVMHLIQILLKITLPVAAVGHGHHAKMSPTQLRCRAHRERECITQVAALNEKQ